MTVATVAQKVSTLQAWQSPRTILAQARSSGNVSGPTPAGAECHDSNPNVRICRSGGVAQQSCPWGTRQMPAPGEVAFGGAGALPRVRLLPMEGGAAPMLLFPPEPGEGRLDALRGVVEQKLGRCLILDPPTLIRG